MSVSYISTELRRLVIARADSLCEYCLIAEEDTFFGCSIDHIISEKHGGPTSSANLGFACVFCNQSKGSDVGSIHWESGNFVRFFNPRNDLWYEHFELVGNEIVGLTQIGEVTARILGFNTAERVAERQLLQAMRRYPSHGAFKRMHG